jgi:CheY-like chemotaxis protein
LTRWTVPFLSSGVAFAANELIPDAIFPAPFFVAAVMIAAHIGGSSSALLTFVLSGGLLSYFYIEPIHTWTIRPDLLPSLLQFVVPCALGTWFIQTRKSVELLLERETEVAKRLQGDQSLAEIGKSVLEYLTRELNAPVAAFYSVEAGGAALRRAAHAFDLSAAPDKIERGEGLVGQAMLEPMLRVVSVPPSYVNVSSSLGRHPPSHVAVIPASDGEAVRAVLELGFFGRVGDDVTRLLERIGEPVAIAVRSATYRAKLQELLDETRQQASELKEHDEELRATNEELEERGRAMLETQRALEQQQAELEQSNQTLKEQTGLLEQKNDELARAHETVRLRSLEADHANRAKSEFLANMSHELRTPLNSSLILAKLLMEDREGNLNAQQIRYAETIYSAGNDLLSMIDEILNLAKIESGKLDLIVEDVPVTALRDEVLRTFEPIAADRQLHFEVRVFDSVPVSLRTDRQRVAQILKNLLSNAFKFTEKGQVSCHVKHEGERCQFIVRDSGIGIPQDQLHSIFEAFQQADGTTMRKYGGTGLGLTISRDLARLLGGEIHVVSAPGQGSTFTLDLPISPSASELRKLEPASPSEAAGAPPVVAAAAAVAPGRGQQAALAPSARRTILVVEDDPRFAEIVVELVRELHFEARVATMAEDAIALATAQPPDGIVLDMKLPDHSGLSVLDRLKRDPRTRHIPVHVLSISDHTRTALEMGAVGYMLKPVERDQIKAALHKLEAKFTSTARRLLVVEDDLAQRDAICQLLGGEGVDIIAVGTVSEALEQLRGSALDCVVMDLTLPDGTGYDLLRAMASEDGLAFPSVVVYTGRSLSAEEEQGLRQYSNSIIVKGARSPERLLDEVTLFLHQVESKLPPERQRMLKKARNREAIFEGRSVLIVEDDVRNVFALTSALEPKGLKLTIARNGREGLAALEKDPSIDLVLMDIMMPEMDGIEATRAIRKQPKWARLPIIALTAKAMKDDQERCLQAGANEYIPKPLDVAMLLSLLRMWIPK